MEKATTVNHKCLTSLIFTKWEQPYSVVMRWLRCHLSFSFLATFCNCVHERSTFKAWMCASFGHAIGSLSKRAVSLMCGYVYLSVLSFCFILSSPPSAPFLYQKTCTVLKKTIVRHSRQLINQPHTDKKNFI